MLFYLVMILLVVALLGGFWGNSRYGYAGWSPAAIIVVLAVVAYFTGHLTLR